MMMASTDRYDNWNPADSMDSGANASCSVSAVQNTYAPPLLRPGIIREASLMSTNSAALTREGLLPAIEQYSAHADTVRALFATLAIPYVAILMPSVRRSTVPFRGGRAAFLWEGGHSRGSRVHTHDSRAPVSESSAPAHDSRADSIA